MVFIITLDWTFLLSACCRASQRTAYRSRRRVIGVRMRHLRVLLGDNTDGVQTKYYTKSTSFSFAMTFHLFVLWRRSKTSRTCCCCLFVSTVLCLQVLRPAISVGAVHFIVAVTAIWFAIDIRESVKTAATAIDGKLGAFLASLHSREPNDQANVVFSGSHSYFVPMVLTVK